MGFFGSFTGSDQRKDMRAAYSESNEMLDKGYGDARGNLETGYEGATGALDGARGDINTGYGRAQQALRGGVGKAAAQYRPYQQTGNRANALYSNALGINGAANQQAFMRRYQGSDPFRDSNADFASNALMRQFNARGMSGSGVAAQAVARENLRRGSQDYENYLNRLAGLQQQGMGVAQNMASLYGNQGQQLAQLGYQSGQDLANIQGKRAAMDYGYGQDQAGLDTDLANTKAGNRVNLGNALANSRGILGNNLMSLLGVGTQAASGGDKSAVSTFAKMFAGG